MSVTIATMDLSRQEVLMLAAQAGCDPRTVKRWAAGDKVQELTRRALEAQAEAMGITRPKLKRKAS